METPFLFSANSMISLSCGGIGTLISRVAPAAVAATARLRVSGRLTAWPLTRTRSAVTGASAGARTLYLSVTFAVLTPAPSAGDSNSTTGGNTFCTCTGAASALRPVSSFASRTASPSSCVCNTLAITSGR